MFRPFMIKGWTNLTVNFVQHIIVERENFCTSNYENFTARNSSYKQLIHRTINSFLQTKCLVELPSVSPQMFCSKTISCIIITIYMLLIH